MNKLGSVKKVFAAGLFVVALLGCDDNKSEKESQNISQQQEKLAFVLNCKVKINLPEGFKKMSDEERVKKFSSGNSAAEAWDDENGDVGFAFSLKITPVKNDKQLGFFAEQMKTILAAAKSVLSEGRVNDHKVYVLKINTPAANNTVTSIMQLSERDRKLLIVSFSATDELFSKYEEKGRAALASVVY